MGTGTISVPGNQTHLLQREGFTLGARSLQKLQKWQFGSHLKHKSAEFCLNVTLAHVAASQWP